MRRSFTENHSLIIRYFLYLLLVHGVRLLYSFYLPTHQQYQQREGNKGLHLRNNTSVDLYKTYEMVRMKDIET
jgi:hypothetical protein